jgi:putative ABC transport system permease protein
LVANVLPHDHGIAVIETLKAPMDLPTIPLTSLAMAFSPIGVVLLIMHRWAGGAWQGVYANLRMLVQLLAIGYVLAYIFRTNQPLVICGVLALMLLVSAWIALRPIETRTLRAYLTALFAISCGGVTVLVLITQLVLDLGRWFEPRFVVPLAGMIFANAMNTVSLAAERFASELRHDSDEDLARRAALDAALIPQVNALLAVGLVSLPGMMTGQILSGVEPLVAARYQIMVMCMIFGSAGISAACYLAVASSAARLPRDSSTPDNNTKPSTK